MGQRRIRKCFGKWFTTGKVSVTNVGPVENSGRFVVDLNFMLFLEKGAVILGSQVLK